MKAHLHAVAAVGQTEPLHYVQPLGVRRVVVVYERLRGDPDGIDDESAAVIDNLIMQGRLIGATRRPVAVSAVGLAVRKGAAKPDISAVESFKRTLLNASSITFGEQGGTGAYLKALFLRLGIADAALRRRRVGGTAAERSPTHHHLCDRRWCGHTAFRRRRRANQIHHLTGRRTRVKSQRPRFRRLRAASTRHNAARTAETEASPVHCSRAGIAAAVTMSRMRKCGNFMCGCAAELLGLVASPLPIASV